jgi:hypothetical protein
MKTLISMILGMLVSLASGCSKPAETNDLSSPKEIAERYALNDGMDLSQYKVKSVTEFKYGETSVIEKGRTDRYAVFLQGKLHESSYWEICYEITKSMLGGDRCFYIDKKDKSLLAVYRSR